jgi:hypothetical protein
LFFLFSGEISPLGSSPAIELTCYRSENSIDINFRWGGSFYHHLLA